MGLIYKIYTVMTRIRVIIGLDYWLAARAITFYYFTYILIFSFF